MATHSANSDTNRLQLWRRVRTYAVPPSMITAATARRSTGDWAGACAAARVHVDLDLRAVGAQYGSDLVARLRADLRHLAPDLLRWHLPRTAPDGLLRPGLTATLARYDPGDGGAPLHLVARTPPAWAAGGQWFSLALWDPRQDQQRPDAGPGERTRERIREHAGGHPHPHPDPRFRLDLHGHLWDARRAGELRERSGPDCPEGRDEERWAAEARLLLRAEGRTAGQVGIKLGRRTRLVLDLAEDGSISPSDAGWHPDLPLLPDAATRPLPDQELLRAGLIEPDALHPLVAAALVPGHSRPGGTVATRSAVRVVDCRGEPHRIGLVDGVLAALDHGPDQLRREQLLAALGGPPLPCLRAVAQAGHRPEVLDEVRGRLDHGDTIGARALIADLLGPEATIPPGPLRDELDAAESERLDHALFRAGLHPGTAKPLPPRRDLAGRRRRTNRAHGTGWTNCAGSHPRYCVAR